MGRVRDFIVKSLGGDNRRAESVQLTTDMLFGDPDKIAVNSTTALQCATVLACVRVIAESLAALPLVLYRRNDAGGRERNTEHPYYSLMHDAPCPWMTSFEFREYMQQSLCLRGNAYAEQVIDGAGVVVQLIPIHPDRVTPALVGNKVIYTIDQKRSIGQDRILHIKGLSTDGLVGLNPIAQCRESIALSLQAESFGSKSFENNAHLGTIFTADGVMTEDQAKTFRKTLQDQYTGAKNAGKPMILFNGLKASTIGISSKDAQFLELRNFQVLDICRIFRVPPHKVADLSRATFSNIEQQSIDFINDTVRPWCVRWEQRLNQTLLTEVDRSQGLYFEFDLRGILRGDSAQRAAYYSTMVQNGIYTRNECRVLENMNPIEGADDLTAQVNLAPLGDGTTDAEDDGPDDTEDDESGNGANA